MVTTLGPQGQSKNPQRFIGVDVGGTNAKAAMIEIEGTLPKLIKESIVELSSGVTQGPEYVVSTVIPAIIAQSLEKVGLTHNDISAFGFDFPCPVSNDGVSLSVGNMEHAAWEGFHVQSDLVRTIGRIDPLRPRLVCMDNDAAAQMLGVAQQLPPEERDKIILGLFVGTGLGGAITMESQNPFKNHSGGSEPGASIVLFDEDRFLFGRPAVAEPRRLEEFVSLVAIERQLQKMHAAGEIPMDHPILARQATERKSEWRVRAEALLQYACKALEENKLDDFSLRIFEVQRHALGLYLQQMLQILRPAHIFLGGGIADTERVTEQFRLWYLEGVREIARGLVHQPSRRHSGFPEFHSPRDGDAAAPFGAAIMAWKASVAREGR